MLLVFYLNTLCINHVLVFVQEYSGAVLTFASHFLSPLFLLVLFVLYTMCGRGFG